MPRLGAYRDNDELDNAIADKVIVYVEGQDDVAFFKALAGPNVADRLEFKTPEGGSGFFEVKKRVRELRPQNPKVHGLLDGEAAVHLGEVAGFLESDGTLFRSDDGDLSGLLFLSEYELENLLIRHAPIAKLISNHVPIRDLESRTEAEVQDIVDQFGRRFYLFSLIKFAMVMLHSDQRPCKGIGKIGGQFLNRDLGVATVMRKTVRPEIEPQLDYEEFRTLLRQLADRLRGRWVAAGLDVDGLKSEVARVADGKEWLKFIKGRFGGSAGWDGLLHADLVQSAYSGRFRDALLIETSNDDPPPSDAVAA